MFTTFAGKSLHMPIKSTKRKKYGVNNEMIAQMFDYASTNSFNSSSAHNRIVDAVESLIEYIENQIVAKLKA